MQPCLSDGRIRHLVGCLPGISSSVVLLHPEFHVTLVVSQLPNDNICQTKELRMKRNVQEKENSSNDLASDVLVNIIVQIV